VTDTKPEPGELARRRACVMVRKAAGIPLVMAAALFCAAVWMAPDTVRTQLPMALQIGFNTSVALLLAGLALLLPRSRAWLGGLVAALGAAVIAQYLVGWMPPDGPWRLALNVDRDAALGAVRMAPLTAFALLCAGLALARLDRARGIAEQVLLQAAPGLVLAAALGGLLNYALDGLLFVSTLGRDAVMRPPATVALCVLVVGYLAALVETSWFRRFYAARAERQVLAICLSGFVAALLLAGAGSVAMLARQMQAAVEKELARSVQNQAAMLPLAVSTTLHGVHARAAGLLSYADQVSMLRGLAGSAGAAWLEAADGSVRGHTGRPADDSRLRLPLGDSNPAWLTWNRGWMLEMHFPATQERDAVVVQAPLMRFNSVGNEGADAEGVETYLCGREGAEHVMCLPSGFVPHSFRARIDHENTRFSMHYAVEGRCGVTVAPDHRGVMVLAAYVPVAELGFGMVREIEAEKIYQPLRTAIWQAFLIIALVGALVATLIYLRVRSVVRLAAETGRRLHGVLDALPIGVWIADAAGRVVLNNPASCRIWGGAHWQSIGQGNKCKGWRHGTGERIEARDWALARALAHGKTSLDEIVDIECADGSRKTISNSASLLYDENRVLAGAVAVCADITRQVQGEAEIRRLEREFHSLAEHLPDVVSRFDRELRRTYANPAIEKATGMSREFLLGKTHAELGVPHEVSEIWTNTLRRVLSTGEPQVFEFASTTKNGIVKHFHTRAVPEYDAGGAIESILTIARDITALKGAEAVLRESEERLNGITANVPGMVFQCYRHAGNDSLHFTYISTGAKWLLDLDTEDILRDGNEFIAYIAPDDVPVFRDSMRHSQETLSFWNWEGRVVTEGGVPKWINLRATPRAHGEDVCMWDGVVINITESKASEEKLVKSQHMLRELSAHLESVREEECKRIAREIHDELGQTLTALRMDVSLARLDFGGSNPKMMGRLQSMTELVDRTIKTARHVTASLRPGALDLGIVAALEWLVEEFIGYAGIPCELVLGDGEIDLDELTATAIFRIVQESLTNVARHAQASQVEIIVTRTNGELCFEVRDNGTGFDENAVADGKSFGLVGMRERVAMMNGTFELYSEPGRGTRIRVCVPAA
jgi:PAS domain S-box-containing protein